MVVNRTSKMLAYINYGMRITIVDGQADRRQVHGVRSSHEPGAVGRGGFRKLPPKKGLTEEDRAVRRVLGFILLRARRWSRCRGGTPAAGGQARAGAGVRPRGRVGPRRGRDARAVGARRDSRDPSRDWEDPPRRRRRGSAAPVRRAGIRPGMRPRHAPAGIQARDAAPGMPPPGFGRMRPQACPRRGSGLRAPPPSEPRRRQVR